MDRRFRRERTRFGYTDTEFAARLGVHPITVSRWERDMVGIPRSADQLVRQLKRASWRSKGRI
jgi:transcriptional regulator with XRE-family HTH domain